jgi:hypothetical protein
MTYCKELEVDAIYLPQLEIAAGHFSTKAFFFGGTPINPSMLGQNV